MLLIFVFYLYISLNIVFLSFQEEIVFLSFQEENHNYNYNYITITLVFFLSDIIKNSFLKVVYFSIFQ